MTSSPTGADTPTDAPQSDKLDRRLLTVASVVLLGALMATLDMTVVNVALKTLAQDFHTELSTIQWVVTGYTLALATVIPITGWGSDRFGTKRLYLTSILLFVAGSVLAGLAWDPVSLIVFRVLQGLGGGMLMPASMTILTRAAGPQRVGRVMAVLGVPMLLGPICGPILGGWLVDDFSWRWIFYINLPIGIIALIAGLRILPRDTPQPSMRLDWLGLVLLSPGLAALIYGFAQSNTEGGFDSPKVLIPAIAGALALAAFIWHGLRTRDALIDLRLFANKVFSGAMLTLLLMVISVFGAMLLIPLYLQIVRGEDALGSGLLMAPQGLGAMLAMPLAGKLSDKTGVGRIAPIGLAVVAIGFAGLTQLEADTSYWLFGGLLFILGLGMGTTMMPTFTGAMQTLRRSDVARATTTLNIVQQVGTSVGTATLSVLLADAIADRLPTTPGGGGGGGGIGDLGALPAALRDRIAPPLADAFGHTFMWGLILVCVAFVVALIVLPKRKPDPIPDDAPDGEPAPPPAMLG